MIEVCLPILPADQSWCHPVTVTWPGISEGFCGNSRVRFANGPLDESPDGHPAHEGQTARQRRFLEASYPLDLTPHR